MGEITWQGEQQIDEEGHNENRQHCANCNLLESEYGRVLFERDLAQRNLRLASYRLGDELQRLRNRENNGAAAAFQEDKIEHSNDETDHSSPRITWGYSELPSAKVLPKLKDNLSSSASAPQDRGITNTNTEGTRNFLNGYAKYLSDSEDSICSSLEGHDDDVNDRVHDSDDNDNDDNNDDNQEIKCNDDDKCDNDDDNLDNDNDDDDDDDSDGDDDSDDNDDDDDDDIGQDASYSRPDGNCSVVSDKVNESLTQQSSFSLQDSSSNIEKINSNENTDPALGSRSNSNIFEEDSSISREDDGNAELLAAGGTTRYSHEKKSPIVSVASNVKSQGARPKTSSQMPVFSNVVDPDLHDGKIPSLDVIGISQGFLARHSTDQSLPYSSNTEDNDLPTSESAASIDWPQTSFTCNDNSSTSWSLPGPSFPDSSESLQYRAYPREVSRRYGDPRNVGYQPVAPMTGLSGWHLPSQQQPQSARATSDFPPEDQHMSNRAESRLAYHDESPSHPNVSGHFLGASGAQGGDAFNRQAWMRGNYETSWRWPRYDYNGYQTNPSNFEDLAIRNEPAVNSPAVNPSAPAVTLPSVTLPNASLNFQTAASDSLTLQSSSSTAMSGSHNLLLSEAANTTEDNSLVALERKVAEACAVVERVLKEREERTKKQREEVQRQREIREQRQREARERREREEREMREREEREARERENMAVAARAPVQESPLWQCEHYQRRCSVRFSCCGVFYPCHRCHNGSGACDAGDKKANQATHVKCTSCGHEEEINEGSQTCSSCGARLSEYFCFKCKHFTGVDKNPFHCDKCGICRIYRDRSFHCDVCNVCLDKKLEGKHKCRPDSGHDECCICLEDAFSGCQILPCSHKVHRECAIAMIQNGVRNCPICRHPLYSQGSQ